MVDCGNVRCAQDRRLFRKELMTWSKKIPLLVGLETIAARLSGDLAGDLFKPWNELEPEETSDWQPENSCFYCKKKLKFLFESVNELEEDDVGNTSQEGLGLGYLNELLPYCPQYYTSAAKLDEDQPLDLSTTGSRSPSRSNDGDMGITGKSHVELKIPQIKSQKFRKDGLLNGKRAYTEDELVAAVGDIRSGKLGTRRAAALYGIPRSTLRNKIFKLETENLGDVDEEESMEDRMLPLQTQLSAMSDLAASKMTLSELMQSSPFLLMPPVPFPMPMHHLDPHNNNASVDTVWDWHLNHIRRKHNLNGMKEQDELRALCGIDTDSLRFKGDNDSPGMSSSTVSPSNSNSELKATILPELVRRLTEQRVDLERSTGQPQPTMYEPTSVSQRNGSPVATSPHSATTPLKIPSFRPSLAAPSTEPSISGNNKESNAFDCGRIGDTLKDIIAKTIAEKVRTRTEFNNKTSDKALPEANGSLGSSTSAFSIPSASPTKKPRKQSNPQSRKNSTVEQNTNSGKENNTTPSQNGNSTPVPVKKTRPKRGQYRKYNSQLLMEAVKAVQRGEMSVHRAGSYFGVPHSTLEYKVKERHLLRQKKIKENQAAKQGAGASSSSENKTTTTSNNSQQQKQKKHESVTSSKESSLSKTEPSNGLLKFDPSHSLTSWLHHPPPNGLAYNPAIGLPASPFTANFAISTPASELLKKLQQKVQNKSRTFCPEESYLSNGFQRPNGNALQDGFLFIK